MSEYWKSVPRKFCDFCKCWITDNKPSVEFHERGKRHQENVELRLREVRKKSLQQSKDDEQMKAQMDKMEQAALEAFKKDLKDNPALAAQYGVSLEPKPKPDAETGETEPAASSADKELDDGGKKRKKKKKSKMKKEWYEAQSPEGYSYYWSTVTGESKWEAPEEYMSLAEQRAEEAEETADAAESQSNEKTEQSSDATGPVKPENTTEAAKITNVAQITRTDSRHARSAYGTWDVVKEVERPQIYDTTSLPPALEEIPLPVSDAGQTEQAEPEPKKPKIKEKVVTLGPSSGGLVAFKKRKIAGARNVRQKADDD